ncbi:autotransporter domain-containing protein [Pelagerythrobacter sp.]|uniref:autotransporter domain-containing protein n=1 Tax=Pelagerythrobacter sp. TaxID=2800702 RepID=UPI0035B230A0
MRKQFFASASVVGFVAALSATPAWAQESEHDQEIASEARGTFSGLGTVTAQRAINTANLRIEFPALPTPRRYEGRAVPAHPELIVRDDIGIDGAVDVNDTLPSVVQIFLADNVSGGLFFNCTGTLINPRTVLTAAHCVNSTSSEDYGLPGEADQTLVIGTGVDTSTRVFNTLDFGLGYGEGGAALSTDVITHASSNPEDGGLPFPWADVALIALDEPVTDVPWMPILLTPLDQLTHVVMTGYGTNGTGDTGAGGIDFLRRVGENMLGAIGSPADLLDAVYPDLAPTAVTNGVETQTVYFTDFDDPNRTQADQDNCTFTGSGISCADIDAVKAIDWFDGDALPQEAGTAGGDSGSPLIADQLAEYPVVVGVLSGGYDFFGLGNIYSDISFYNPLFPFFEFISENTPYKYVSARAGGGVWSDPNYWTQDLDPGFLVQDENGNLVNGLPGGSEPGVYETGPKIGTILGDDVSDNSAAPSPFLPPPGTPNFGANTPNSSNLLGPGSTGFVPNNTDGTPGDSFTDPAQYFDVLLTAPGRTVANIDVEIDRLTIDGDATKFLLPASREFVSNIGVEQYGGESIIYGTLDAGFVLLFGGRMDGYGTVRTDAFFNVSGSVSPHGGVQGEFVIDGDYIQTSGGVLRVNVGFTREGTSSDLLTVTGDASLAGGLIITPSTRIPLRFNTDYTIVSANSVIGNFDVVALYNNSPVLKGTTRVVGGDVILEIGANSIAQLVGRDSGLTSVGAALDEIRFGGRYGQFTHLFDIVDNAGYQAFGATLASLTPTSAFGQSASANAFAQRFTGQLAQRTLSLRGAGNAAAGFSAAGSASFAQAGIAPREAGKLGFFGSVSGSYLTMAERDHNTGATAFQEAAFSQAGELTLGADYRLSDALSVGVAVTNIRNSAGSVAGFRPAEDESVATATYAATTFGRGFADMYLGYASQRYGLERNARGDFTAAFRSAIGSAEGEQTFGGARIGYAMEPARGVTVGPVASLDYVRSNLGAYSEFAAGQFGLDVRGRDLTSLGAKLGAMASLDTAVGRTGKLSAFGSLAYARELGDMEDVITASFFGAPDQTFTIANQLDPEWVSVNAGAELSLSNRFSTKLSVTSDMGRGVLTNNRANLALNWKF